MISDDDYALLLKIASGLRNGKHRQEWPEPEPAMLLRLYRKDM